MISDPQRVKPGGHEHVRVHVPPGARYAAQGSYGSDYAVTFELAEYGLDVLWRPGPRIDLLNARGDGPPVDAGLVWC